MSISTRVLTLCADDFGLSESISNAIIELVKQQRLSSVSCITNAANFPAAALALQPHRARVEIGLHFNLTEGRPLTAALSAHWPQLPSVAKLIFHSHLGAIPRAAIEQELHAQWQMFYATFGTEPDFIDGHQHVHDLPVIRDLVIAKARTQQKLPWIRNTGTLAGPGYGFKRAVIKLTGGLQLSRKLHIHKLPGNSILLGVYDFKLLNYRRLMQRWLGHLPANGGLIFCHPGLASAQQVDTGMALCRAAEFHYFASKEFMQDLHSAHVHLGVLSP